MHGNVNGRLELSRRRLYAHPSGTDADSLQIQEVVLGDSTPHQYNDVLRILPGSSLAAYYNPASKSRFVIYQADSDSLLREYTVDGGGKFFALRHGSRPSSTLTSAALFDFPDNPIANSTDASAKTALAVVLASGVTYVYYTHGSVLRRVARAESPEWGPSADVADAFPVAADSQITAVVSGGYVHVFYVAENDSQGGLLHVKDLL